ncbi:MAG: GMC family oxidoreductase N-terminal domain-containing protein [Myxococcota bacterium]
MSGRIIPGAELSGHTTVTCDVCVIGSGAGGAVLAEGLVARGLDVVMLEAGPHHTRDDFIPLDERWALSRLYQDSGGRATADQAITVLQGRTVGGSTTVNWTTCFRTPERILTHWAEHHGVEGYSSEDLRPHFEAVEARLNIKPWPSTNANENNRKLLEGCEKLGWKAEPLRRNVDGCADSGYCGLGCPVDAKQAMGITYIPDAVKGGMRLYCDVEATRLDVDGDRVRRVEARALNRETNRASGATLEVKAKLTVVSGGAINSPALLLRSGLGDDGPVGQRTFLHPVVTLAARYPEEVEGFFGAPQSIGSHQFIDRGPEKIGFFLEVPPLQPVLASGGVSAMGIDQAAFMRELPFMGVLIALHVDGLLPGDDGGTVTLREQGRVKLDYPIRPALAEGFRASHEVMARIALAAGAQSVNSTHHPLVTVRSEGDLPLLQSARYGALEHAIFSAHQMGGCAMGSDPKTSVVRSDLRHHRLANLFIVDGSVLPTALGVNPSETIYAIAHRAREAVAAAL